MSRDFRLRRVDSSIEVVNKSFGLEEVRVRLINMFVRWIIRRSATLTYFSSAYSICSLHL